MNIFEEYSISCPGMEPCHIDIILNLASVPNCIWFLQKRRAATDLIVEITLGVNFSQPTGLVVIKVRQLNLCTRPQRNSIAVCYTGSYTRPDTGELCTISSNWKDERCGKTSRNLIHSVKKVGLLLTQSESQSFPIAMNYSTLLVSLDILQHD